jgi:hypothetical protein
MEMFGYFDVLKDHRAGTYTIKLNKSTSDGDSDKWLVPVEYLLPTGEIYRVEEANELVKEDWLSKLGYMLAAHVSVQIQCVYCDIS